MKKILSFTIGMLFLVFSVVASAQKNNSEDPIYDEDNTTIHVTEKNPQFTIKLKSNPTTGYMWFVREYSLKMMTPIKHSVEASEGKLIGAPGYELWKFRVNAEAFSVPHLLIIRMVYTRPWKNADAGTQVIFRVMTGK